MKKRLTKISSESYNQIRIEEGNEEEDQDEQHQKDENELMIISESKDQLTKKDEKHLKISKSAQGKKGGGHKNKKKKKNKEKKKEMDAVSEENDQSKNEENEIKVQELPKTPQKSATQQEESKQTQKKEGGQWGERTQEELQASKTWYYEQCKKASLKQWDVNQDEELGLQQSFGEGIIEYQKQQSSQKIKSRKSSFSSLQRNSSCLVTEEKRTQSQNPNQFDRNLSSQNSIKAYQKQAQTNTLKKLGTLFEAIDCLSDFQKIELEKNSKKQVVKTLITPTKQSSTSPLNHFLSISSSITSPSSSQVVGKIDPFKPRNKFFSQLSPTSLFDSSNEFALRYQHQPPKQKVGMIRVDSLSNINPKSPTLGASEILEGIKILNPLEAKEKSTQTFSKQIMDLNYQIVQTFILMITGKESQINIVPYFKC